MSMQIFSLIPLMYAFVHLYFFIELSVAYGRGFWQVPALVWFGLMVWGRNSMRGPAVANWPEWTHWLLLVWFGVSILLLACLFGSDILRLLLWLGGRLFSPALSTLLPARRAVTLVLLLTAGLSLLALYTARTPTLSHITIPTTKLSPETGRVRLVQLSDMHLSKFIGAKELRRVMDLVARQNPDILVITGDLVDTDMSRRQAEADIIRSVPTRYGAFAVMGNHELYRGERNSTSFIRAAGLQLLRGQAERAGSVVLVGVDDPAFGRAEATQARPILEKFPPSDFVILLKHRPEIEPSTVDLFDLQLSGHTHGGQVWPGYWITRLFFSYRRGLTDLPHSERGSHVHVSDGVGYWGPPMRLGTKAEVVMIDLVPMPQ